MRIKRYLKLMHLYCFVLFGLTVCAQITPSEIDQFALDEMVRQELPGLAIGIYKKGLINYSKGYGYIDLNRITPMTKSTVFGWASISKTLTAVATLQLAEQRDNFNINDKVIKHYPFWTSHLNLSFISSNPNIAKFLSEKKRKEAITIKHLLGHRGGINHYKKGVSYNKDNYTTDADGFNANSSVKIFRNMALEESPGTKYRYSTYGYNLLGAVVDKVSGSYTGWVNTHIKNKLGLSSLENASRTRGFQKKVDGILNEVIDKKGSKEYVLPAGGWKSNIQDLLKFSKGIIDGKLLDDTSKLWVDDFSQEYKRGVKSINKKDDFRIWHGGSQEDIRTMMYIMPDDEISIVIAYPSSFAQQFNLVRRIMKKLGYDRGFSSTPMDKCGRDMGNSGKHKFLGVWRKTNTDVVIRRGYTSNHFKKEWDFLKTRGYQVFDIEPWKRKDGSTAWDGIFKKSEKNNAMWRNFNHDDFKNKWADMNSKGYRLFDLETYVINGQRKWAGLFKKSTENGAMWRNMSTKEFDDKRKVMQSHGLQLIDIEVFSSGNKLKWSSVWLKGTREKLNRNLDYNNFKALIQQRSQAGYKLIDVETYKINGNRKWAGVWEKTPEAQKTSKPLKFCDFMEKHAEFSKKNYELIDLVRFKN